MTDKKFSKKEAISFGFQMTKKYFKVILLIFLIFGALGIMTGIIDHYAGLSFVDKSQMKEAFGGEEELSKRIYLELQEKDYFGTYGFRHDKLKNLNSSFALEIDSSLELYREEIYEFLQAYRYQLPVPEIVYQIFVLLKWLVHTLMGLGLIKMALSAVRDQKPKLSDLFSCRPLLASYLLAYFLSSLAVLGGLILFIIPGIIISIMFQMFPYIIVTKGAGPIAALKRSRVITKGSRYQLFLLGCLLTLVNLAGGLCLLVGLLWTIPTSSIAVAYVYDKLAQEDNDEGNE